MTLLWPLKYPGLYLSCASLGEVEGWNLGNTFEENCFHSRNHTEAICTRLIDPNLGFHSQEKENILQEDENVIELPLTFSDPLDVQLAHVWHCWFLPILFLHLVHPHPLRYRVAPEVCNESSSESGCQMEKGEETTSVHFFHLGFHQGGLHACLWGWPPGKGDQL